jgi:hypothetical protein
MLKIDIKTIAIYIRFLIYKLSNGLLFSLSVYFFVENNVVQGIYPILIIQEFYFSYFYTAKKNQEISTRVNFSFYYYLLLSTLIFVFTALYFQLDYLLLSVLAFSLFCFNFYACIAPSLERNNVTDWVEVENKQSLISVLFLSSILGINWFFDAQLDKLMLARQGIFYCWVILFVLLVRKDTTIFKRVYNANVNVITLLDFFKNTGLILVVFLIKFLYFDKSIQEDKIDGQGIKYFMVMYDVLAAVIGLMIRRTIAIYSENIYTLIKRTYISNIIIVLIFFCTYWLIGILEIFKITEEINYLFLSLFVFLNIAIHFNLFTFKELRCKNILLFSYVITAVLLLMNHQEYYVILIPFISTFIYLSAFLILKNKVSFK